MSTFPARYVSSDGQTIVEVIRLTGTDHRDGEWLRVTRSGYFAGEVRTPGELARLGVDLADLTPEGVTR